MLSLKSTARLFLCAMLVVLHTNSAFGAQQSKGTAKVTANIPEFIVLHYYSSLTLNFATPTSEALDEGANEYKVSWEGEAEGDELSASSLMDADLEFDGNKTTIKLPNVWAVRGFSKSGNAEVSITIPSGSDVLKNGDSTIAMSDVQLTDGSNTGSSIKTNLGGIAKSSATFGGVIMDLDFSNTKRSGSHVGGQYTITASTI